jgi:hypothetical protein
MQTLRLEVDLELYGMLKRDAQANNLTVEQECMRRLEGAERQSRYMQALVAELRADDEQQLASTWPH